jgi:hypothetical protein
MRIRQYKIDELIYARRLQDEAAKLHCPMPVMSWKYEVKDAVGNIEEEGEGKANSFTRNALNMLAYQVGCSSVVINSSSVFADGVISFKGYTGGINSTTARYTGRDAMIYLGTGTAESLDNYIIPEFACNSVVSSVFDASSRKLITSISGTYANTGVPQAITEAGVINYYSSSAYQLMVHDIFDPIVLETGKTISFTYVIEVAYPNP